MIYMFLSNNPSSGDINSSNLSCLFLKPISPLLFDYAYFPLPTLQVKNPKIVFMFEYKTIKSKFYAKVFHVCLG